MVLGPYGGVRVARAFGIKAFWLRLIKSWGYGWNRGSVMRFRRRGFYQVRRSLICGLNGGLTLVLRRRCWCLGRCC